MTSNSAEVSGERAGAGPDAIFSLPRLAEIYDALDGDRNDLDAYGAIAHDLGARSVLDVGCGTGELALRLAANGIETVGVDPANASLDVARTKPGAEHVGWVHGVTPDALPIEVDVVTMTGNVAQVFIADNEWDATLVSARSALRDGGHLVFEARDPAARAWFEWTPEASRSTTDTVHGPVESWVELTEVALPLVSFRWTFRFLADDTELTSDSTLRFRSREEITASLERSGFAVTDVRGAPDRPGREFVFIARAE